MVIATSRDLLAEGIVPLSSLSSNDARSAGAKAAHLGELLRAGFPVPEGFVLPASVFARFMQAHGLDKNSSQAETAAAPLPGEMTEALESALLALGEGPLAVRSSALAEDLPDASYAGQYETFLDVQGLEELSQAVRNCWASAFDSRVAAYQEMRAGAVDEQTFGVAVLVQKLVRAEAAGVAFSVNPVTGDTEETIISAVRGLGERLVSGQATPDDWSVRGAEATCQRAPENAIDKEQALAIAALAQEVAKHFGSPQDIEWAIADEKLFLLQARPITALPEKVEWEIKHPGGWARDFRLGEWLGEPTTPLFASWLLGRLDDGIHAKHRETIGLPHPNPAYVLVNGWYYCSMNQFPSSAGGFMWIMLRYWFPKFLQYPRRALFIFEGHARSGTDIFVREWREQILPGYQALIERGTSNLDSLTPKQLIELLDELTLAAGRYFGSITHVTGFGWKSEVRLARFYREHLDQRIDETHQTVLQGLYTPSLSTYGHAVHSLDWVHPTLGECDSLPVNAQELQERRARLRSAREAAVEKARAALANEPELLKRYEHLLDTAQWIVPIREEQVFHFTLGWPLMRTILLRVGEHLRTLGAIESADDVYFLTRDEVVSLIQGADAPVPFVVEAKERRDLWNRRRKLTAPLVIGELPGIAKQKIAWAEAVRSPEVAPENGLRGQPASPGRVTARARIIRRREDFENLQTGEVLVAPATTPAWTPLFARAAAVVTDTGSCVSHSSLVAREYGIPAVVGTGNATSFLRDGQLITVNGNAGSVEILRVD